MTDFSVTITPRFYETDALGHINNAVIAAWFEVARASFLESMGDGDARSAEMWVLASLKIDFIAETFYGSDVTAHITGVRPGNSSLTVECEMSQGGRVTVRGTAVIVHLGQAGGSPTRISDALREKLASL